MPVTSDISANAAKFQASNIEASTEKLNQMLEKAFETTPKWYEVGAATFRQMILEGKTQFPVPPYLPNAEDATIPSRDPDRDIVVRVYKPDNAKPSKGIFLYLHGGGFVIGTHKEWDTLLESFANSCQLTSIAVGYRLAPEDPFPAGVNDCIDVAEYLVDNGLSTFGIPLRIIAGGSAGGNFAALTTFQLMRSRPHHRLAAVLLNYGAFDLTINMPTAAQGTKPLVINRAILEKYIEAYVPGADIEARRNPLMSPLYEDMQKLARESPFGSLPPALFNCGTADPLLDDSLMMSVKWMASGSEAVTNIYPGAPHMFTAFKGFKVADDAMTATVEFLKGKLGI
ncbi:MAG: hypothetical protein Q9227_002818 [Pyrenula ochraceoflavens]